MELRIGHLSCLTHTAFLLQGSDYAARRLEAELRWMAFGSGRELVDALGRGEIDMGYSDLVPALLGLKAGVDVRCVAGGHVDGLLLLGSTNGTESEKTDTCAILGRLRGQDLGVLGEGGLFEVVARYHLERCGLLDAVRIRVYHRSDDLQKAFLAGEVSAVMARPDEAVALRAGHRSAVLLASDQLWPWAPTCGVLVSLSFMKQFPDTVRLFVELHEEATGFIRKRPEEAASTISRISGIHKPLVMESLLMAPRYCGRLSGSLLESLRSLVLKMNVLGYALGPANAEALIDESFIDAVHPPGDHYRNGLNLCRTQLIRL